MVQALFSLKMEKPAEAEPLLREALDIRQQTYDENDWRVAQIKAHLAKSLLQLNQFDEAELLLLQSYTVLSDTLGAQDIHVQNVIRDIDLLYALTGKPNPIAVHE
jgi:thioredoxin-like negative regulator of GroEL